MAFSHPYTLIDPRAPKRAIAGFTLIELLIVVAVISVLAAMLLPAMQKARYIATNLTCLNTAKQVGLAVQLYSDDNDGEIRGSGGSTTMQPDYVPTDLVYRGCPLRNVHLGGRPEYSLNGKYSSLTQKASWLNETWRNTRWTNTKTPTKTFLVLEWRGSITQEYNEVNEAWQWVANGWSLRNLQPIHQQKGSNWIFIDGHGEYLTANIPLGGRPFFSTESQLSW